MSTQNGISNGQENGHGPVIGIDNVDESDTSSYMANYKAHKPGISQQEMVKAYSDWADNYDQVRNYILHFNCIQLSMRYIRSSNSSVIQDLCPGRYNGP